MRLNRRFYILFAMIFVVTVTAAGAWGKLKNAEWFVEMCGVERWSVKTGTDSSVGQVNLNAPQTTTLATMVTWPAQSNPPANSRVAPYETTVWVVDATLVEYKSESDEDYHIVLKDSVGNTIVSEIPAPHCVSSNSPFLAGITNARNKMDAKFNVSGSFQTANIPVRVTGIGMFDFPHGQTGAAPNQIELHPIIDIIFNPGTGAPPTPTNLTATAGNGQIALNWTASTGAASYTLYRSTTSGTETSLVTGITGTTYLNTGLTNGTTYYYKVTAVNASAESGKSNEASAAPNSPPPAPTNLTATSGSGQITLAWNASPGAASYTLYRSTAAGSETSYLTNLTTTGYVDTAVLTGRRYYYKVTASNAYGVGAPSNEASAIPLGNPPSTPANLIAAAGNGQIILSWDASTNMTSYTLYRSNASGTETSYVTGLTTTTYTDTGVTNGTTYYYQVTAVNAAGESGKSNEVSATPTGTGTVSGRVVLQGVADLTTLSANAPLGTLQILFRSPGTLTTLYTAGVTITPVGAGSAFGTYASGNLPAGTYDIALKMDKGLRKAQAGIVLLGSTVLPDVTLLTGDITGDNAVDITDFGILVNAYGSNSNVAGDNYLAAADLNYDGVVDILDFGLLVNNYGSLGDP